MPKATLTRLCLAASAAALAANAASADLLTYQWDGVTAGNSIVQNQTVQVVFTIDTDTALTSTNTFTVEGQTATRYVYDGAIVSGHYQVGEHLFPFVTEGEIFLGSNPLFGDIFVDARNTVTIVENNASNGARFNAFYINASTDYQQRGGITSSTILINLFDHDLPRDTVLPGTLDQPLDTLHLPSQGGIDRAAFTMGALVGSISSSVTSGEGYLSIVPEPGSLALLGLGTLTLLRRRRH
ncbi:MAG: PEP-CTERM sorting domain-containing protein [Phycisphaerales bacterium JB063]